jgi:hypothetical protein
LAGYSSVLLIIPVIYFMRERDWFGFIITLLLLFTVFPVLAYFLGLSWTLSLILISGMSLINLVYAFYYLKKNS